MMSLKKMVELYLTYGLDEDTWDMLYKMTLHGLISNDTWSKFFNKCKGWYNDDERNGVADSDQDDKLLYVWEEGVLVQVK